MQFIDYYQVLGVPSAADDKTIKTSYRKLVLQVLDTIEPLTSENQRLKQLLARFGRSE
jgi:curved DNA-binding protein CbpA